MHQITKLLVYHCTDSINDPLWVGKIIILKPLGIRRGHIGGIQSCWCGIKPVEAAFADLGDHFAGDRSEGPGLIDDEDLIRHLDPFDDGFDVEWADGAHVEHIDLDAFGCQCLGGFHAEVDGATKAHQGDSIAFTGQAGSPKGDVVFFFGDMGFVAEHALGLHEEHRVRVVDRGFE